jgi:hypothetical protein
MPPVACPLRTIDGFESNGSERGRVIHRAASGGVEVEGRTRQRGRRVDGPEASPADSSPEAEHAGVEGGEQPRGNEGGPRAVEPGEEEPRAAGAWLTKRVPHPKRR